MDDAKSESVYIVSNTSETNIRGRDVEWPMDVPAYAIGVY